MCDLKICHDLFLISPKNNFMFKSIFENKDILKNVGRKESFFKSMCHQSVEKFQTKTNAIIV